MFALSLHNYSTEKFPSVFPKISSVISSCFPAFDTLRHGITEGERVDAAKRWDIRTTSSAQPLENGIFPTQSLLRHHMSECALYSHAPCSDQPSATSYTWKHCHCSA